MNSTSDGYRLGIGYGYYTAALTWACSLLNISAQSVSWKPIGVSDNDALAIKESVAAALSSPCSVTVSSYAESPR